MGTRPRGLSPVYGVHLVDIVPAHIEQAERIAQQADAPRLASARVGDARNLAFDDGMADGVVMRCECVLGILGSAWMVPNLDASWQDEAKRQVMLGIARLTENEPVLGPRLMAVARSPC